MIPLKYSFDQTDFSPVDRIIGEMYEKLEFPAVYDETFFANLGKVEIPSTLTIEEYPTNETDGIRNLFSYLYLAHKLEKKYAVRGIPENIRMATLHDLVVWTNTHSDLKGTLYLGELGWLRRHLSMDLFHLGRLQFAFGKADHDSPKHGLKVGDPVIEVHIPEGSPLTPEECEKSFEAAKEFFAAYFPEYEYKCFTCHSWLLDSGLQGLLGENSNILKFAAMFDVVSEDVRDGALGYIFKRTTTRQNLPDAVCHSSFAQRIKNYVLNGGILHESLGIIMK